MKKLFNAFLICSLIVIPFSIVLKIAADYCLFPEDGIEKVLIHNIVYILLGFLCAEVVLYISNKKEKPLTDEQIIFRFKKALRKISGYSKIATEEFYQEILFERGLTEKGIVRDLKKANIIYGASIEDIAYEFWDVILISKSNT